jgi:hypothetical protein
MGFHHRAGSTCGSQIEGRRCPSIETSGIPSLLYDRISRDSSPPTEPPSSDYEPLHIRAPAPFDNLTEALSPQRKTDQMHCHDHRTTIPLHKGAAIFSSNVKSADPTTAALSSTARMVSHPYSNAQSRDFAYPREAPPKAPGRDGSNYYGPWGIPDPLAAAAAQAGYLPSNANSNALTSCRCCYIRKKEWRAKPC